MTIQEYVEVAMRRIPVANPQVFVAERESNQGKLGPLTGYIYEDYSITMTSAALDGCGVVRMNASVEW